MSIFKKEGDKCPGCGKTLKDIKAWERHSKCKKLLDWRRTYNLPTVDVSQLAKLTVKRNGAKEWAVWNAVTSDWIRDNHGNVDSRVFERNARSLLSAIIAASILDTHS